MTSQEDRRPLLEDMLESTYGTVSTVLKQIRDVSGVRVMPIPQEGFPMNKGEIAKILGVYEDGESFVCERKVFPDKPDSMTLKSYYLRRKNEDYVYELEQF